MKKTSVNLFLVEVPDGLQEDPLFDGVWVKEVVRDVEITKAEVVWFAAVVIWEIKFEKKMPL